MKDFVIKEITSINFHDKNGDVIAKIDPEVLKSICNDCPDKYECDSKCLKYDLVIDDIKE